MSLQIDVKHIVEYPKVLQQLMAQVLINDCTFREYFLKLFLISFLNHHYFQGIYKLQANEMVHQLLP